MDPSLLNEFVLFIVEHMLSKMGVDRSLAKIPVNLGGLGLLPWDGKWPVRSWSTSPPIPVDGMNTTDF